MHRWWELHRFKVIAVLAGVLALVASACGDDGDSTAAPSGGEQAAGNVEAYCEAKWDLETTPEPEIDWESASEEEMATAMKGYFTELLPLIDVAVANVPAAGKADIDVLAGFARDAAETGDGSFFESPEFQEPAARLHAVDLEACGWGTVDVTGTEYAFAGIPESIPSGPVSFEFANEGEEMHEMVVLKNNSDLTLEELFELGEEEAMKHVTFAGAAWAAPGDPGYFLADLEPGTYIVSCFVPVGSTPEAVEGDQEPQGAPHFTQGMSASFTVS